MEGDDDDVHTTAHAEAVLDVLVDEESGAALAALRRTEALHAAIAENGALLRMMVSAFESNEEALVEMIKLTQNFVLHSLGVVLHDRPSGIKKEEKKSVPSQPRDGAGNPLRALCEDVSATRAMKALYANEVKVRHALSDSKNRQGMSSAAISYYKVTTEFFESFMSTAHAKLIETFRTTLYLRDMVNQMENVMSPSFLDEMDMDSHPGIDSDAVRSNITMNMFPNTPRDSRTDGVPSRPQVSVLTLPRSTTLMTDGINDNNKRDDPPVPDDEDADNSDKRQHVE